MRRAIAKSARNEEEKTIINPTKRLIELLNPNLGKFCKTFYKQHIKLATKLTCRKKHQSKYADILSKSKENSDKEQAQSNTESRPDEENEVMPDAYDQYLLSPSLPLPIKNFHIPPESVPKPCRLGFEPKISEST